MKLWIVAKNFHNVVVGKRLTVDLCQEDYYRLIRSTSTGSTLNVYRDILREFYMKSPHTFCTYRFYEWVDDMKRCDASTFGWDFVKQEKHEE